MPDLNEKPKRRFDRNKLDSSAMVESLRTGQPPSIYSSINFNTQKRRQSPIYLDMERGIEPLRHSIDVAPLKELSEKATPVK